MPPRRRRIEEADLPEDLRNELDNFRQVDDRLSAIIKTAKEENSEFFMELEALQVDRNGKMERVKTALKTYLKPVAEEDPTVGECRFGEFIVQPRRSRGWNIEKFLEAADDLGISEVLMNLDPPAIIPIAEHHFNEDRARELGLYQQLLDEGVVHATINFQVDGKAAEDTLEGELFMRLREMAWEETLSSLGCSTPAEAKPL